MTGIRAGRARPTTTAATAVLLTALCVGSTLPASAAVVPDGRVGDAATSRVIVTLRDAPDLPGLPGLTGLERGQRLSAVINRLRTRADTSQAPLRRRLKALEALGEITSETPLWVANAISVTASARAVRELAARPDVLSVSPDAITVVPTAVPVEPNIAAVHAPDLWAAGQTGQGVVVAMLDTGVDLTNPDLAARWRGGANSWFDPYGQHPTAPVDLDGHGTGTAGLVVGGADAGTDYGMAPGATLIAARIFDDRGATTATAMHQAFQWVLDPDHDPATADAPQVVNGSWALGAGPSCNLAFQPDVQALRAAGILPVFSAGNFGPSAATSASPANYPESLSVGAVGANDVVWAYSSAGPSTCGGRARVFPDLVAPGVSVLSADRFGGYQYLTGTSVAAPHVSGAAALLLGAHPALDVTSLESALTSSAVDLGPTGADDRYGQGRLDVTAADAWAASAPDFAVSATPAALTTTAGGSATSSVTVVPAQGFATPITLSVQGLPSGASPSFTPSVLGPGTWGSTLVVSTTTAVVPGSYPLTVTASAGGLTRSAPMTLTVTAPPDFTMAASPTLLTVKRGQSASTAITVATAGGAPLSVTLSVTSSASATAASSPATRTSRRGPSGATTAASATLGAVSAPAPSTTTLPTGVTATWTGNPVTAPGTATLRLAASSKARAGTYSVVVTGSSPGRTHTVTLTLLLR